MKKYIVYILKSKIKETTYVGFTNNIERRLIEHNSGKSKFTSIYRPWEIVYKEEHTSLEEARKREKYLKTASGRRLIKKLLGKT
jgi:putative endonuclease